MSSPTRPIHGRALGVLGVAAVATVVLSGWLNAAPPVKTIDRSATVLATPAPVHRALSTDLKIDGIFGVNCKCDLVDVDAVYMGRINVTVSNNYMKSGGATTESLLTVTYFDMKLARQVTVTKNLTALHPYPTNPWVFQEYQVVTTPVLVRKSTGIRAEIKPTSAMVTDSDPSNNVMIERDCKVMIY